MVTKMYAIKSHLHQCCQAETIVLYQLVFTVKTIRLISQHVMGLLHYIKAYHGDHPHTMV